MMPNDWRFTPVKGKRPYLDEWQKNPLTLTEAKAHKHTGIGLMLGPCSGGTMAIDFDGPEAMQFFADTIGDDVPEACMWTSLKPGRFQMAFRVPESEWPGLSTKKIGPGNKLEFRWTNAQSVIPPSWHPEMGKYEWVIEPTLENTSIVIPDNILAAWREACKPPTPKVSLNKHKYENETVTVEEVRQYLNKIITPGYDDWIRLTWACVNVLGKVDGIALMKECFPEEVAGEYDKLEKTYREAPSEGVCGMGTIVHMAGGRIDNRPDADARQRIKDRYYAQKKQTVK